jgi:glucuronate isomerase
MKKFLGEDFLLNTKTAVKLFENYAKKLPIIDYHSHVHAGDIFQDRQFENLTEAWLEHDHYKWRLMRARGVPEEFIAGRNDKAVSDFDRFKAFAKVLPHAMGNPVYHFCHLELRRVFDCNLIICEDNAEAIWNICNEKLKALSVREIIRRFNVEVICTTDDPINGLFYHEKLLAEGFPVKVLPSFRPDRAVNIEKPEWNNYVDAFAGNPHNFSHFKDALKERLEYFAYVGCKIADHGVDALSEGICDDETAEKIFQNARNGEKITAAQANLFRKNIMKFLCEIYAEKGFANLIHVGVKRNINTAKFDELGADTGFDSINPAPSLGGLADLLDSIRTLPKTVIFSLNPNDNALVNTIAGSFSEKVVQGPAWWFSDTEAGIRRQLADAAQYGVLGNFPGMLTDSRSFLSYSRHEYFRRILCDTVGTWVEQGLYPNDEKFLGEFITNLCYKNAKNFFGF